MRCDSVWFGTDVFPRNQLPPLLHIIDSSETSFIIHQGTRRHVLLNIIVIHVNAKTAVIMLAGVRQLTRPLCHC